MTKVLKSIVLNRYSIELVQIDDDYMVVTEDIHGTHKSSLIQDFKLASYMFDLTLQQLEGF